MDEKQLAINLIERALAGDITLDEFYNLWPEPPKDEYLAQVREDIEFGIEHTPGFWTKPGVNPKKWQQEPEYAELENHLSKLKEIS